MKKTFLTLITTGLVLLVSPAQALEKCPGGYNKNTWSGCYGAVRLKSGVRIDGEWQNGALNGKGKYQHPNGTRYIGEWRNNKFHGKGVLHVKGKKVYGIFKNGKLVRRLEPFKNESRAAIVKNKLKRTTRSKTPKIASLKDLENHLRNKIIREKSTGLSPINTCSISLVWRNEKFYEKKVYFYNPKLKTGYYYLGGISTDNENNPMCVILVKDGYGKNLLPPLKAGNG